jgi:hypothetical protein
MPSFDCPFVFNMRLFHGIMMGISWGFMLPIGATVARFGHHWPNGLWFKIHRPLQMTGIFFALGGFVAAFFVNEVGKFSAPVHPFLGALVMLLGLSQPINAYFRPHKEEDKPVPKKRVRWEYLHKYTGRIAVFGGLMNPFWGLSFMRAHAAIVIIYSLWVAFLVGLYIWLTISGKPESSPFATKINQWLCCAKGKKRVTDNPDSSSVPAEMDELATHTE